MTNYRIDRIGTHRHASTPNSTTSTRQNRGRCMNVHVRFHGTNIGRTVTGMNNTIRYDTIGEFNVDSKAEYSALSSTRSQKKKLKQTTPVPL